MANGSALAGEIDSISSAVEIATETATAAAEAEALRAAAAAAGLDVDAVLRGSHGETVANDAGSSAHENGGGGGARAAASRQEEDEESGEDEAEAQVDDDLKDAVEGALRLKRLLSSGSMHASAGKAAKRRRTEGVHRTDNELAKIEHLLVRWGLLEDTLTRHVLENMSGDELDHLLVGKYSPPVNSAWKCAAELLHTHINSLREGRGMGGGPADVVRCFAGRFQLDADLEQRLRGLRHKELRYVLREYNGLEPLPEVIARAADADPDDEGIGAGAAPTAAGVEAMRRYTRLELIDPVADSAVFGDANLTFSLNLARQRKAFGHVGRVIATTFETLPILQERYKEIVETIRELEAHFAEVYHGVDCTRIALDSRLGGLAGSLGAVYYNFPHAGAVGGFFDGHPVVNWRHENLMRLFFRALRSFVQENGIVKVASNSQAVGVRFSYILNSAALRQWLIENVLEQNLLHRLMNLIICVSLSMLPD
eukprot:TRINITY_DN14398_c1_g1_i2.p2 TRINITY_DN14398_c1_g1~~TRINITY_DN14398_c1_g1_i2.p2  ORF type:complete len:483 (+),score=126.04 TRINITY_DN14398_c1_g1_i2:115-1563(+)